MSNGETLYFADFYKYESVADMMLFCEKVFSTFLPGEPTKIVDVIDSTAIDKYIVNYGLVK